MDQDESKLCGRIQELEGELYRLNNQLSIIRHNRVTKVYCYKCKADITQKNCQHLNTLPYNIKNDAEYVKS